MKAKNMLPPLVTLILVTAIWGCSPTRNIKVDPPLDSTDIRKMIDSASFVFVAQYVSPWNGRRRDLSPGYEISVSKDSIISDLPYFGRGYTAPVSPSDIDFNFTATKFSYKVTRTNKGWNISIKTQDQTYLRDMLFRLYDNGKGNLNITSIDRSAISYDGYIKRRTSYKNK